MFPILTPTRLMQYSIRTGLLAAQWQAMLAMRMLDAMPGWRAPDPAPPAASAARGSAETPAPRPRARGVAAT